MKDINTIIPFLETLAKNLGVGVEELLKTLISQAPIYAISTIIGISLWIIGSIILTVILSRIIKKAVDDGETNGAGFFFSVLGISMSWIISIIYLCSSIYWAFTAMYNPKFWALTVIFNMVKGGVSK
jgi:hypothetical protein